MATNLPPLALVPFVNPDGTLTQTALSFLQSLINAGGVVTTLTGATTATGLVDAYDDANAKANGVPQYGLYWNGSVLQIQRTVP